MSVEPPNGPETPDRKPVAAMVTALVLVLVVGLLTYYWLAGRPDTSPGTTETTSPPASSTTVATSTSTSATSTTVAPTTTAPQAENPLGVVLEAPVPVGTLVIAGTDSVRNGLDELVLDMPMAELVTGDGRGGLLAEQEGRIWWLRPDGSIPSLVAEGAGTPEDPEHATVELHAGLLVAGEGHVVFVRNRHSGDSTYPQVVISNLDQGTERVLLEPAVGEGRVTRVSVGGDLVAVSIVTDGGQAVILQGLDDDEPAETMTEADLGTDFLGAAVLTPDGSTLIYLDSSPAPGEGGEEATDLVWIDLSTRGEMRRETLPVDQDWNGYRWAWLDADAEWVAVADLLPMVGGFEYGTGIVIGPENEKLGMPVPGRVSIVR